MIESNSGRITGRKFAWWIRYDDGSEAGPYVFKWIAALARIAGVRR